MFNTILAVDSHITAFITNLIPHSIFFDVAFSFLSLKGYSILIWVIILGLIIFIEEKRNKKFIILFFSAFILTAFIASVPLKMVFHRQRPIPNKLYSKIACPTDYSFPSGHAATAFAAAGILVYYDKKRAWLYYLVAFLVSLSRIYLQCHYLLDVVSGATIGLIISRILLYLFEKKQLEKKVIKKTTQH